MGLSSFTWFSCSDLTWCVARRHLQVLTSFVSVPCAFCHPIIFVCEFRKCVGAFPCIMPRWRKGICLKMASSKGTSLCVSVCVNVCVSVCWDFQQY